MNLNLYNSTTKKYLKELGFYLSVALLVGLVPGMMFSSSEPISIQTKKPASLETYVADPVGKAHFELRVYKVGSGPGSDNFNINDSTRLNNFTSLQINDIVAVEGWIFTDGQHPFEVVTTGLIWDGNKFTPEENIDTGYSMYPGGMLKGDFVAKSASSGNNNEEIYMITPKEGDSSYDDKFWPGHPSPNDSTVSTGMKAEYGNDIEIKIFKQIFKVRSVPQQNVTIFSLDPSLNNIAICSDDQCSSSSKIAEQSIANSKDVIVMGSGSSQCNVNEVQCTSAGVTTCVDVQNDSNNCGSCSHECTVGKVCSSGSCVTQCGAGETECNGACVDTQNDNDNCGSCNTSCSATATCVEGSCGDLSNPTLVNLNFKVKIAGNLDDYNTNPLNLTFKFNYDVTGTGTDNFSESRSNKTFNSSGLNTTGISVVKDKTYNFILKPQAPYVAYNPFHYHTNDPEKLIVNAHISDTASSPVTIDFKEVCLGDLNQDHKVDSVDATILTDPAVFYKTNISFAHGDLNRDGIVNAYDWSILNRCNYLSSN